MQHQRLTLSAFLAVLHWLLDGQLALAKSNVNGQQNYGSFSGSGLDQDGGLQPAVGGYITIFCFGFLPSPIVLRFAVVTTPESITSSKFRKEKNKKTKGEKKNKCLPV